MLISAMLPTISGLARFAGNILLATLLLQMMLYINWLVCLMFGKAESKLVNSCASISKPGEEFLKMKNLMFRLFRTLLSMAAVELGVM